MLKSRVNPPQNQLGEGQGVEMDGKPVKNVVVVVAVVSIRPG